MDVKSEITHLSATRKELTITVPAEAVQEHFEMAYRELGRYAKVAGFRPGRVPRSVLRQKFRREIHEMVIERLLPRAIRAAAAAHHLHIVSDPSLTEVSVQEGHPLTFKATVEVLPEIDLGDYKGRRVTMRVKPVTEADIDEALGHLQQQHATLIPVEDRPAALGDYATVKLEARVISPSEEAESDFSKTDVVEIEIGGEDTLPAFTEHLVGLRVGESCQFRVHHPPDAQPPEWAGREVEYRATLEALRIKELPPLDDEFPRSIGEAFDTLAEFRQELKRRLERSREAEAQEELSETLLEELVDEHPIEVPETLVKRRLNDRIRRMIASMLDEGIDPRSGDIDWERITDQLREQAIKDVRASLILGRIADLEHITVSTTELEAEIARLARRRGESVIQLKRRLTKEGLLDSIKNEIRNRKALELVMKAAEVEREGA